MDLKNAPPALCAFGEGSAVQKIAEGLKELGSDLQADDKGKFPPHEEQRVGCEIVESVVNAASPDGSNQPGEYGVMEADNYYEGLRDRGLDVKPTTMAVDAGPAKAPKE